MFSTLSRNWISMTNFIGKIRFVNEPALPAKCVCCGNHWKGQPEQMIDFQVSLDEYGALLFCESCGLELAKLLAVPSIEQRNEQIRNLTVTNQELQAENVRLNAALNSLFSVRPDLRSDSDSASAADSEDSDEGE